MNNKSVRVQPIGWRDMLAVTHMTFDNMIGVDRYFTKMVRNPLGRWFTFVTLPLYLRFSGQGFKVVVDDDIAGCGFLDMRDHSGYIFNINVGRPFRRRGLGRQLMMHLESVITGKGQDWAALQVDRGNLPAEQLYRQLGYRVYHPHFMRRESSPPISRAPTAGVSLQQMERHRGRSLYKRYQNLERQNGDFWVASVVDEYDSWSGMRGTFWRCLLYDREIGCGQCVKRSGQPLIRLAMAPPYWGHLATGGIVKALVDTLPGRPAYVDLFLESSTHHRAAEPILNGLGFRQHLRSRMLMLKPLSGDLPEK